MLNTMQHWVQRVFELAFTCSSWKLLPSRILGKLFAGARAEHQIAVCVCAEGKVRGQISDNNGMQDLWIEAPSSWKEEAQSGSTLQCSRGGICMPTSAQQTHFTP